MIRGPTPFHDAPGLSTQLCERPLLKLYNRPETLDGTILPRKLGTQWCHPYGYNILNSYDLITDHLPPKYHPLLSCSHVSRYTFDSYRAMMLYIHIGNATYASLTLEVAMGPYDKVQEIRIEAIAGNTASFGLPTHQNHTSGPLVG